MFKTRVTELFKIEYPILGGAMMWLSDAVLAAAVSNAGGLGIIASAQYPDKESLREEVRKAKSLTNKPIALNVPVSPHRPLPIDDFIDVAAEEGLVLETAVRNPAPYAEHIKQTGVTWIHKCARVRDARTAERLGVKAISVVGFEGGGHPGMDEVGAMILVPLAAEALEVPMLAAGGIADGRGFAAALSLGAEGVVIGTRLMATEECWAHQNLKQWMINAEATDTLIVERSVRSAGRFMKNEPAWNLLGLESRNPPMEELLPIIGGTQTRQLFETGDLDCAISACGQVVGLIHDVVPVKVVIDRMVNGAREILKRISVG